MEIKTLDRAGLDAAVRKLPRSPVVALLLYGDRLTCCDEGVSLVVNGQVAGLATIAPDGEEGSGEPTIVAVYVRPEYRRRGYSQALLEAAIRRCQDRGFARVRVDVMSAHIRRAIAKLPPELSAVLDVHDLGDIMGMFRE